MDKLTAEQVRHRLDYDPETGIFTWRNPNKAGPARAGMRAGKITNHGYVSICVDRRNILGHRLAWLWMTGEWPVGEIDHKDTDRANNRWGNLRPATSSQNKGNARLRSDNTSGYKGVFFDKVRGRWFAQITKAPRQVRIGYYKTAAAAALAYEAAAQEYWGEYARAA